MSLTNPKTVVTEERLSAFYQKLLPYLGGSADAGFTPVGTIIPMIAEDAPANYLKCNGDTYNKSDYPELADHLLSMSYNTPYIVDGDDTKFKVPDLRGEFIRGTGTNSHANQGSGSAVGTHQDSTQLFQFNTTSGSQLAYPYKASVHESLFDSQVSIEATQMANTNAGAPWSSTSKQLGTVRPTNTSVLLCIATKNIYLNPSLDYSTSEKVVGTWIDGKPLYQKTIDVGALPNATSKNVAHGISNIDRVISIEGTAFGNGQHVPLNFPAVSTLANGINLRVMGANVQVTTGADKSGLSGVATIRYTKIT